MKKAIDEEIIKTCENSDELSAPFEVIEIPVVGKVKDLKVTFFDKPTEKVWIPKPRK